MAIVLIPYGQLQSGRLGIAVDDVSGQPIASAIEVQATLPLVGDADNFDGRMVFAIDTQILYVFKAGGPEWFPLEGIPVVVGVCNGPLAPNGQPRPPVTGSEVTGTMFYCTDTDVTFVWDGGVWQPIGGRFAGRWIEQKNISTGVAGPNGDTFALGGTPVAGEFVEVFLDGVRQVRNPGGDYNVVGANVIFSAPIPVDVEVFTRTFISTVLEGPAILPNTQVTNVKHTAVVGQTDFDIGIPAVEPSGVFVFVNGLVQCGGGVDYLVSTSDTTITSITRSGTTATATTLNPHGASIGSDVEISGATESDYNGTFTITAIPTGSSFQFTIPVTAPLSATGNPVIFYTPPFINDEIIFTSPLSGGELVDIRVFKSLVTAPSDGEDNTASNIGTGEGIFSAKSGVDLRFKTLEAGPNINIVDLGNELQISTSVGATFEGRNGINTNLHLLADTESYIGVRNTSFIVTIDVSTVPAGTAGSGRRVVITDESGGAGTNNILISHVGATFSGAASPLIINTNHGSKTIVFDGSNWHIVAET